MKLLSGAIVGTFVAGSVLANPGPSPEPEGATRPVFVASAFARLDPRTPELGKRFRWPATGSFQATHQQVASATPFRVIAGKATLAERGKTTHQQQVVVALDPTPGSDTLRIYPEAESRDYEIVGALHSVPAALWLSSGDKPFTHTSDGMTVRFTPTAVAPTRAVEAASWTDWTYATTLMAVTSPVYVQEPPGFERWGPKGKARGEREREHLARVNAAIAKGDPAAALAAITAALATSVDDTGVWGDFGWETVVAWTEARRALDAAMGVRARFRPVGRCSMDSAPQNAAMAYADLCYAAGKLGCFLDLQVRVMGDQFERVASSSYGEAAHQTHAERLRGIGIDPARFLRGLVFRFAVPGAAGAGAGRRELDPWRLARSMKEAGLVPEMTAFLKAAATKAELDTFNRMRAAETYAYLRFHNETPANRFALGDTARQVLLTSIREDLAAFNLPEPAATWARTFGKN